MCFNDGNHFFVVFVGLTVQYVQLHDLVVRDTKARHECGFPAPSYDQLKDSCDIRHYSDVEKEIIWQRLLAPDKMRKKRTECETMVDSFPADHTDNASLSIRTDVEPLLVKEDVKLLSVGRDEKLLSVSSDVKPPLLSEEPARYIMTRNLSELVSVQ